MMSNSEPPGYAAIDNEVESDLESTTRSEPKCKEMEDTCESGIVTQVTNNVNNANANGGKGGNSGNGNGDAIALTRWIEKMKSVIENCGCAENQKVKYAASSFINKALTWWNTQVQARGHEAAMAMTWVQFKAVEIKSLLDVVGITAAQVYVNTALMKLVLLMIFKKIF
nr:reverse transcriptase domain-containing protein [Tanacetum cinerariifolium]